MSLEAECLLLIFHVYEQVLQIHWAGRRLSEEEGNIVKEVWAEGPGREDVFCWDDRDEQFTGSHPNSDSESPKEEPGLPLDQPLSTADLRGDLPGPSSVPRFSQIQSAPWEREKIMNLNL